MIKLTAAQITIYRQTANGLKGSERRRYMASIVQTFGYGGQRYAETTLGWNRRTVRKGLAELTSGISQVDHFSARGRKRAEARLPNLLADLQTIVESHQQPSATTVTQRLTIKLNATTVRQQLIEMQGYEEAVVPSVATIRKKLAELGYVLRPVRKQLTPNI